MFVKNKKYKFVFSLMQSIADDNVIMHFFLHRHYIWWRQLYSPWEKEACAIHQGAAQGTGKGVRRQ